MTKIRRISGFQHTFLFESPEEKFELYFQRFLTSQLGQIWSSLPWDDLVRTFGLKKSLKGPHTTFSPKGMIALMFLKHYTCSSDKRMIEQLNGNIDYQFFCDIFLGEKRLTNYKIVSQIRCVLSKKLKIADFEQTLFKSWSPYIENKSMITVDATCYESELRFPTDQKLLWECVNWSYKQMKGLCKELSISLPRTKYKKWVARYHGYSKMRKKTKKKRTGLTRSLLMLLKKINDELDKLEQNPQLELSKKYRKRRATIKKIYVQQADYFKSGKTPKNRIVSIEKDYLRPIVRGKEIKSVEFGAKVNKLQIDGINSIEHLSFDNFNEGTRLKSTVFTAQVLSKTKTKILGADAIYATNNNRNFITKNNIQTDFKKKGKPTKHEKHRKQMAKAITKERASRLEGSFGKEKEYYHLKKVKARTKKTEILWIIFGIHTANALEIGRRMQTYLQQTA